MHRIAWSLLAAAAVTSTPAGQTAAPLVEHRLEFAGGAALSLRYAAVAWDRDPPTGAMATVHVTKAVRIGNRVLGEGTYRLQFEPTKGETQTLVFVSPTAVGGLLRLPLRKTRVHTLRFEAVLTAAGQDGHGVLRIAFGDYTARAPVAPADPSAVPKPKPAAVGVAAIKEAAMAAARIHETVQMFMVENRRRIPTWKQLLTPDARGNKYLDLERPPVDPWGNEYVIGNHPRWNSKPIVTSWGPDGLEGTTDDIVQGK